MIIGVKGYKDYMDFVILSLSKLYVAFALLENDDIDLQVL